MILLDIKGLVCQTLLCFLMKRLGVAKSLVPGHAEAKSTRRMVSQ